MNTIKKITLIISLGIFSFGSFSQNVDDIIQKHIDAHGGAKKLAAIKTMRITGQFTAFSIAKEFTAYKRSDGSYYADLYLAKYKVFEAFDGKNGWTIDPWQEIDFPRQLNKAETAVMMQKADIVTPFFRYKEKGYKVELTGEKEMDGVKLYVLKLTRNNNQSETWYLNKETYLEFKCESPWVDFAWPIPSEAYYDDFRNVNGIIIPFYIERTFNIRNRIMEIENIEFNVDFDESKLLIPQNPEMEKLAFLAGNWSVVVKVMNRRGTWQQIDSVVSAMNFHEKNILTEHISYERMFPMDRTFTITYNRQIKKYRLTVYNSFDSNLEIYEGDFVDGNLVFDNVNINFGEDAKPSLVKYVFSNISETGFTLEKKETQDNGETWVARDLFVYVKIK